MMYNPSTSNKVFQPYSTGITGETMAFVHLLATDVSEQSSRIDLIDKM